MENAKINIYRCNDLEEIKKHLPSDRKVIVIIDSKIKEIYGSLFDYPQIGINASEQEKSFTGIEKITQRLLELEADRGTFILAAGGGTLTDLAGFVASIFMRGVDFAYVPTTLLAQVDAAIGGKTAINFEGFKNILGVIRQPEFTVISPVFLKSLSEKEIREGVAEMLKTFLLRDKASFNLCNSIFKKGGVSVENLGDLPYKTAMIKAAIVEKDPNEKGDRILLNLGHTFAHSLEKLTGMSHGEAVGTGVVLAAKLSVKLGLLAKKESNFIEQTIAFAGLPVKSPVPPAELSEYMKKDKKRDNRTIRFVLLQGIGNPIVYNIGIESLRGVLDGIDKY
jgi:3-dehydroquinate synthase